MRYFITKKPRIQLFNTDAYQNNWPGACDKPGTYFYRLDLGGKVYNGWGEVMGE